MNQFVSIDSGSAKVTNVLQNCANTPCAPVHLHERGHWLPKYKTDVRQFQFSSLGWLFVVYCASSGGQHSVQKTHARRIWWARRLARDRRSPSRSLSSWHCRNIVLIASLQKRIVLCQQMSAIYCVNPTAIFRQTSKQNNLNFVTTFACSMSQPTAVVSHGIQDGSTSGPEPKIPGAFKWARTCAFACPRVIQRRR